MQRALNIQQSMAFGGGEFIDQIHQKAPRNRVYLARIEQNSASNKFIQMGYRLADAIEQAKAYQTIEAADCYATVNGFGWRAGSGRSVSSIGAINGLYVDFDRYKQPSVKDLEPADFLAAVLNANPWLPCPTMFEDSGNGCWMFWLFDRALLVNNPKTEKYKFLEQWQTLQGFLVQKLKPFAADPVSSDAARLVRLAGTINTKTGRMAQAWTTGQRYKFADLKTAVNAEYRRDNPKRQIVPLQHTSKRSAAVQLNTGKVSNLFSLYSLAYSRMQDMKRLAQIRGGRLAEHRRKAIWIYATFAAQYCRLEDTLRAEVDAFISDCIESPKKYQKAINYDSTVDRFKAEESLIASGLSRRAAREQLGREKSCYQLSSRYIIEQLDIDADEQRQLKTIISKDEKQRRNTISKRSGRRQSGVKERGEYLANAQQRQQQAIQLRTEGLSIRTIADRMGLSVGAVHRYLVNS